MHPYISQGLMSARVQDLHARAARRRQAREVRDAIKQAARSRVATLPLAVVPRPRSRQLAERVPAGSDSRDSAGRRAA
jgi:hypothetical protein